MRDVDAPTARLDRRHHVRFHRIAYHHRAFRPFAMAREGRVMAPKLTEDIVPYAERMYKGAAPELSKAETEVAPALLHLSLTPVYLRKGERRAPLR